MTWARDLLREIDKLFPIVGEGRHALVYDPPTDALVLFLNIYGDFQPVSFTEEEYERDPVEVAQEVKKLVDESAK